MAHLTADAKEVKKNEYVVHEKVAQGEGVTDVTQQQKELERSRRSDEAFTQRQIEDIRKQLNLVEENGSTSEEVAEATQEVKQENVEERKAEYIQMIKSAVEMGATADGDLENKDVDELEYIATTMSADLICDVSMIMNSEKEVIDNFENYDIDMNAVLDTILSQDPMYFEQLSVEEYDETNFLNDMARLPWLELTLMVVQEKMQAKLEYDKNQMKKNGVGDADNLFENKLKQLEENFVSTEARTTAFMEEIASKYELHIKQSLLTNDNIINKEK